MKAVVKKGGHTALSTICLLKNLHPLLCIDEKQLARACWLLNKVPVRRERTDAGYDSRKQPVSITPRQIISEMDGLTGTTHES